MGHNNKFPLPPECDDQDVPHPTSGHTNIGLFDYFTAMDNLAEQKNFSPENAEFNLKAYQLRDAVGGRIGNATTAFEHYIEFMKETPEEVRQLQIPSVIRSSVDELFSYLTWYFRLSFKAVKTKEINEKNAQITELIGENAPLKETIAALTLKEANLLTENQQQAAEVTRLAGELTQVRTNSDKLKIDRDQQSALLREAEQSKTYSEQIISDLRLQLSEKKEEISLILQRNESLNNENKKQQTEISNLSHHLDISRTQYDAAASQATMLNQTVTALENQLVERNKQQIDLAERNSELERHLIETKTALETSTESVDRFRTELNACKAELIAAQTSIIQVNAQLAAERTISVSLRETVSQLASGSGKQNLKARSSQKKRPDADQAK